MNMIPCGPNSNAALEESKNSHIVKEENNEEEEEEIKIQQVKPTGQIPEIHLMNLNETSASTCIMDQSTKVAADTNTTNLEVETINSAKETPEQIREKCKERMDAAKRDAKKEMPLSDQLDMRNPQYIAEFAQDVFNSMIEMEKQYLIDNEYLKKVQTEIKDTSRGFLVEWIIDVNRKFRLLPETLYVTISIIDRFLSKVNIKKS